MRGGSVRFILVDEIIDLVPGRSIRAIKRILGDEEYFQDHFPGFPVVPGVLLTEMMAQTAGKCLMAEDISRGRPMLGQIDSAKFLNWVLPGNSILLTAEIQTSRRHFATANSRAEVDGKAVCSAKLLFSFLSTDLFAPDYRDLVLEEYFTRTARSGSSAGN
jgi:3-hydroxyacyl-[acyl-carrier-protein] dehydratase